jgi:signal transduction histidine kinase
MVLRFREYEQWGLLFNTLSGRFLGLTIIFVVIAEVLFFVPAMSRFRYDYLQNRLELAQLAALATAAIPQDQDFPPELEQQLLSSAGVLSVVLRREDVRELVLPTSGQVPDEVVRKYDLTKAHPWQLMRSTMAVFLADRDRIIQVIGQTRQGPQSEVEITLHEWPLHQAMVEQGLRILYVSLAISLATAALLFLAVQRLIVRPIGRVVEEMTSYRDDPEDASRIIEPQRGARELRQAEEALHELEVRLTTALRQKDRLASLGGALAKISHDLRNLLTTAQLVADRIETSADPAVRRVAPKLVSSLSRAISLCERTLAFGKAEELPPELADFALAPLVAEVLENERQAVPRVSFAAELAPGMRVRADADQLFRVLTNLVRNAAQAIEAGGEPGRVTVIAAEAQGRSEIRVKDTGPGLPEKARENLFQPFRGGVRQGGTGLGLVIAADLVRGHGCTLALVETGSRGSTFRISLP